MEVHPKSAQARTRALSSSIKTEDYLRNRTLRRPGWRGTGAGAEHTCPPLSTRVHESATRRIASAVVEPLDCKRPVSSPCCGNARVTLASCASLAWPASVKL